LSVNMPTQHHFARQFSRRGYAPHATAYKFMGFHGHLMARPLPSIDLLIITHSHGPSLLLVPLDLQCLRLYIAHIGPCAQTFGGSTAFGARVFSHQRHFTSNRGWPGVDVIHQGGTLDGCYDVT
jgi:hypothetical protein